MTINEKKTIVNLIKNGKIEVAFKKNSFKSLDETDLGVVNQLESRLNNLKRDNMLGIIDNDYYALERNKILYNFSELINTIKATDNEVEPKPPIYLRRGCMIQITFSFAAILTLSSINYFSNGAILGYLKSILKSNTVNTEQLTISIVDSNENVAFENTGEINIHLGHRSLNAPIGNNGKTNFSEITPNNLNDSIMIGLKAEGWEIDGTNKFLFTGEPIKLKVKRNERLIKGIVKSSTSDFLEDVKIVINADTTIYTQQDGLFKVELPQTYQRDSFQFYVLKDDYKTLEENYPATASLANLVFELEKLNSTSVVVKVMGCTDPKACNYDPKASENDGNCKPIPTCNTNICVGDKTKLSADRCECLLVEKQVNGCTNPNATNFNPKSNCDDGSCVFPPPPPLTIPFIFKTNQPNTKISFLYKGKEYEEKSDNYNILKLKLPKSIANEIIQINYSPHCGGVAGEYFNTKFIVLGENPKTISQPACTN